MHYRIIYTKICLAIVFTAPLVRSRKYDVESEAVRLYGEDFKSILQKFRRSPDYLQILEEKYNEMVLFFGEVATYAMQFTMDNRLKSKVADACGFDESTTTTTTASSYNDQYRRKQQKRQGEEEPSTIEPTTPLTELPVTISVMPTEETTVDPIELLEKYPHYANELTAQERNSFRDLAFEITGQMIHMIIKSMGPVDTSKIKSSRGPLLEPDNGEQPTKKHGDRLITQGYTDDSSSTAAHKIKHRHRPI